MDELNSIRKIIDGVTINTDTAHNFHLDVKLVSEQVGNHVNHRRMVQGLYQAPDGNYFLAFWNKPNWNNETLSYEFINDATTVAPEQAQQWIRNYCPEKFSGLIASMEGNDKSASMQTLTLRLTTELKNHFTFLAKISDQSINKICLNFINTGMSIGNTRALVSLPPPQDITMPPDGRPALDQFGKALKFVDPDEQALAGYAESLYDIYNFNYPGFLPFALHTLYRLLRIVKREDHALCFSNWLSRFHRATYDDAMEYNRRNQSKN